MKITGKSIYQWQIDEKSMESRWNMMEHPNHGKSALVTPLPRSGCPWLPMVAP